MCDYTKRRLANVNSLSRYADEFLRDRRFRPLLYLENKALLCSRGGYECQAVVAVPGAQDELCTRVSWPTSLEGNYTFILGDMGVPVGTKVVRL
jgi:hypothetical protein